MNCLWEDHDQWSGGKRRVRCQRCGLVTAPTKHPHERIHAACQAWPLAWEWGSWLAIALAIIGLRCDRWSWLRVKLGFVKACGCKRREAWLNTLPGRLVTAYRKLRRETRQGR